MGTAWASMLSYPWWTHGYYVGGIETVKVNIMLRIYANKWHVYAGLAILNPSARKQIDQYAKSTTDIFKLMIEGDEEAGSRGFRQAVKQHKDEIGDVDFVLLSNSYWLDDHVPCLTFGMRGVVHANVEITSGKPDLHSGMDGKSLQHEPLKDLTVLMSSLIGPTGTEVLIPKFYDSVDPLQPSELRAYKSIATALMAGHPEIKNEEVFTQSLMQRWREPNLTIHSITVPSTCSNALAFNRHSSYSRSGTES